MDPEDHTRMRELYAQSLEVTLRAYLSKVLVQKPVRMVYRERAYVEFIEAAIHLKKELVAVAARETNESFQSWLKQEIITIKDLLIKIEDHVRTRPKRKKHH